MANHGCINGVKTRGRGRAKAQDWAAHGFTQVDWNKHQYTWEGRNFPVFTVSPGLVPHEFGLQSGIVARCGDVVVYFEYGTDPATIKDKLDDEILAIMRLDVEVIDWPELEEEELVIPF